MSIERSSNCGNPECPTGHQFPAEDATLPVEDRPPCPECGSLARSIGVTIGAPVAMASSSSLMGNGATRLADAQLTGVGTVAAEVEVTRAPKKLTILGLPVTHVIEVRYADLQPEVDAPCLVEIRNENGEVLAFGGGITPADALSVMFEQMLPPTSSEYVDLADDEPLPDDL